MKTGLAAKGNISSLMTVGNFAYTLSAKDPVTNKITSLSATLVVYDCQPTGFTITPNSLTVRVSGPSLTSTWSKTALNPLCGDYSVNFDA